MVAAPGYLGKLSGAIAAAEGLQVAAASRSPVQFRFAMSIAELQLTKNLVVWVGAEARLPSAKREDKQIVPACRRSILSSCKDAVDSTQAPWAYIKLWTTDYWATWDHSDLPFFTTLAAVGALPNSA